MRKHHRLPLDQIQGNITPGFRKDYQAFLFLRFPDEAFAKQEAAAAAGAAAILPSPALMQVRAWLGELLPCIASAETVATFNRVYRQVKDRIRYTAVDDKSDRENQQLGVKRFARSTWVNVAFTARGLGCLLGHEPWGTDERHKRRLEAFRLGMCNREFQTNDSLDDIAAFTVRDSVRSHWLGLHGPQLADEEAQVAHAVVIIGTDDPATLTVEVEWQKALAAKRGLTAMPGAEIRGKTLGGGREHFGFVDSVSQPDPDDALAGWVADGRQIVSPGEFIRGCQPEPEHADAVDVPPWERHGSYLVLRKLEQDVESFWAQAAGFARRLKLRGTGPVRANGQRPEAVFVAAKMVGRWPGGAPMTDPVEIEQEAPIEPSPGTYSSGPAMGSAPGDFARDSRGALCPLFAHSRRANPRVPVDGISEADLRTHRIIRRGVPYDDPDAGSKGLVFLAYQARIEDGYEYVQSSWLNSYAFGSGGSDSAAPIPGADPLSVESNRVGQIQMLVKGGKDGNGDQYQAYPFSRVVTAKGGGYFFSPSIDVIGLLSTGSPLLRA